MSYARFSSKLVYFSRSSLRSIRIDKTCPFCNSHATILLHRKFIVTALYECNNCGLRFRVPKDEIDSAKRFYESAYKEGFTTELPTDEQLHQLLRTNFRDSEKDYREYIKVLEAAGIKSGVKILDYGCSWGYGSWQIGNAGYQVYSYDLDKKRTDFASQNLGCEVVSDLHDLNGKVDCFFSAHVIEHLPDPKELWEMASLVLNESGILICVTPNGDPCLEEKYGKKLYHQLWGKVHPLLLNPRVLNNMADTYNYCPYVYTSPFPVEAISQQKSGDNFSGRELLLIAYKSKLRR